MRVQYSLKHSEGKLENPLLGTEATDGLYADVCPHGQMYTILIEENNSHWFGSGYSTIHTYNKNGYKAEGDRRFASFPANTVIIFTQDCLL